MERDSRELGCAHAAPAPDVPLTRVCYLVMLHHKFEQALRLLHRLQGPEAGFVLHIDRGANPAHVRALRNNLTALGPIAFARRIRAKWGSYAQARAIMECIRCALERLPRFDRYVLISGQDYPIASGAQIQAFFSKMPQAEYLEAFPCDLSRPDIEHWSPYYRFRCFHFWTGEKHHVLPILRKKPPQAPIFHGSTWWALTRAAIEYVAREFESDKGLRRYFKTSFLVDEAYIPSLIMSSPFAANVRGDNVTFAQWTDTSGPHPKVLGSADLDVLLQSPKLFARKLDASVDESLLNLLDRMHAAGDSRPTPVQSKEGSLAPRALTPVPSLLG